MREAEEVQGLEKTTAECNGIWLQWRPVICISKDI